jgi:hypothetical protein
MEVLMLLLLSLALSASAPAAPASQLERGTAALRQMTGCFYVDYNFSETESLKAGYERDKRVYDVNRDKSVKEWIYLDEITPTRFRLQHVMFVSRLDGTPIEGAILKHTGEDWELGAASLYDFDSPNHWSVRALQAGNQLWTRRVVNLDDGLRYQCAAAWSTDTAYPEWSCAGYAPIPGREYRDMGRKDYQGLERSTRLIAFGQSWLDRQANVKVIQDAAGKTPLAREVGKTWYTRLPDAECAYARSFAEPRHEFWGLLRETWDEVFAENKPFVEKNEPGMRYGKILGIEEDFASQNLRDDGVRRQAKEAIRFVIDEYRER